MSLNIDKGQLGMTAQEKLALLKKQLLEKANSESAIYPMSFGQKALYFLQLSSPESHAYNVSFSAIVESKINYGALKTAFQKLVNRHSALRTNYRIEAGIPSQIVHGYKEVSFTHTNSGECSQSDAEDLILKFSRMPFDLEGGDVMRVYLITINPELHYLLVNIHHISNDGRSIEIMLDELDKLYRFETGEISANLPHPDNDYHNFVGIQDSFVKTEKAMKQLEYWSLELSSELPVLDLPFDRQRKPFQTFNGDTVHSAIDLGVVDKLKNIAKVNGATLFSLLLTAYMVFLRKHTSDEDIITGIPAAGRGFPGFEKVIGYFINPLSIRAEIRDEHIFSETLSLIKRKVLDAVDNQDIPFQLVVDKLLHSRDAAKSPVFQTFFGLLRIQGDAPLQELLVPGNTNALVEWAGLKLRPFHISQQEGQFDLTMEIAEGHDIFSVALKYNTDLFDRSTAELLSRRFAALLAQIADNPSLRISDFTLMDESDRNKVLIEWNNTSRQFQSIDFIDRLFEKAVRHFPDNICISFEGEEFTYHQINRKAEELSARLRNKGLSRGDFAAICLDRCPEMVIAMLAVLKSGAAYVPIDTDYPADRITYMLENSGAKLIITNKSKTANFESPNVVIIDDTTDTAILPAMTEVSERDLSDPAYVIYTSGSTGLPKGVVISHKALSNHMAWMKETFEFTEDHSVLQKTPYSFDASVWEFYLPLLNGGKLVIAKPLGHMDMKYLLETVSNAQVTHLQFVPSLLRLFINEPGVSACKSLKFIFSGGEALTGDLLSLVHNTLPSKVVNLYGPTEATIDSVYHVCSREDELKIVPIGIPVSNMKAFVVDNSLNLVPHGISGELLLGGDGISIGYLNNPDLTEERFIDDHIAGSGGKLYRTGDKARFNNKGLLEFLGRIDHQVKFRGYRIELGEIESCLRKHPVVDDACAEVLKDSSGRDVLSAYVVAETSDKVQLSGQLKNYMRQSLPEYMIPGYIKVMDALPRLPNGKLDRSKLPQPVTSADKSAGHVSAEKPVELTLANIWKDILGVDEIGIHDNFFELGGDSILSIQIISRAAREGLKITPRQIFMHQTIAELAKECSISLNYAKDDASGELKLLPVQKRFIALGFKNPSHFNHSLLIRVKKGLDIGLLSEALKRTCALHDAFRISIKSSGEAYIPEEIPEYALAEFDFSGDDLLSAKQRLKTERARMNGLLNLESGRLVNAFLARMPDEYDALIFNIHHICIDGVSWRIFLDTFTENYQVLEDKAEPPAFHRSTSFRRWCELLWEYSGSNEVMSFSHLWNSGDFETSSLLPSDYDRHLNIFSSHKSVTLSLHEELTSMLLNEANKAFNTSPLDLMLSALVIAFKKHTGRNNLAIDLEGHGREEIFDDIDLSNTIGWFTSVFPVNFAEIKSDQPDDVIKNVKEILNKYSSAGINYGILRYLRNSGERSSVLEIDPQIAFNYLGQFKRKIHNGEWAFETDSLQLSTGGDEVRQYLLEINSMIVDSNLSIRFDYSDALIGNENIADFAMLYLETLEEIIRYCTGTNNISYTASDFSESGLSQQELDDLLSNMN